MKNVKLLVLTLSAILFMFGNALAVPIMDSGEKTLQEILDDITVAPVTGASSVDVQNDQLPDLEDFYWGITGSAASSANLVIEIAGWAEYNSFGIFDFYDYTKQVQLFGGPESQGDLVQMSIKDDGSVWTALTTSDSVSGGDSGVDFAGNRFGFYFTNKKDQTFFSDTNLNDDGFDHMVGFQGTGIDTIKVPGYTPGTWTDNEFIFAWEDTYGGGDKDYNDMVLIVESIEMKPVPEPATMVLLGLGLIGLGTFGRKKRLFAKK